MKSTPLIAFTLGALLALPALAADKLRPGQWEVLMKMQVAGMPEISAEQIAQMEQFGIAVPDAVKPQVFQQCVTPEQTDLDKPDFSGMDESCQIQNYKRTGNKLTGNLSCNGEFKANGNFEMVLLNDTTYQGQWVMTGSAPGIGAVDQTTRVNGKWVKAKCDAGVPIYGK